MLNRDKIAIITGVTSGIGEAAARLLTKKKVKVIGSGRSFDVLNQLEKSINHEQKLFYPYKADVTSENFMTNLFKNCNISLNLNPNLVIISAGIGLPGTLLNSDDQKWYQLLQTNYLSVMHQLRSCASEFLIQAEMENCKFPKDIIVIGSTIGRQVSPFNPVYGSTKFAIHSIVEALRQEVCHKNIRVTLIEPGFVKSGFQKNANYDPIWFESIQNEIGPLLLPEDVAHVIDFIVHQPTHIHLDNIRIRPTKQKV